MRANLFIISAFFMLGVSSCYSQKRNVSLKLSYYTPYCGGARPTKEIEEEARKPKPLSGKTIMLVKDAEIDSVRTDKNGMMKKKLRNGEYKLLESWRYYHGTPDGSEMSNYDRDCLKNEW